MGDAFERAKKGGKNGRGGEGERGRKLHTRSVFSFNIIFEDDDLPFPLLPLPLELLGPAVTLNLFFKFSGAFVSEKSSTMINDSAVERQSLARIYP